MKYWKIFNKTFTIESVSTIFISRTGTQNFIKLRFSKLWRKQMLHKFDCITSPVRRHFYICTLKKLRLEIAELEKARFIKVNELKLTQDELFWFFHIMCAAANASALFSMAFLANIERFLYHSNLSF